jgi:hypothetical protein
MWLWLDTGFELNNEFTECLLRAITNSYSTFTILHTLQITKAHKVFPACYIFTSCCLVVAGPKLHSLWVGSHVCSPNAPSFGLFILRAAFSFHHQRSPAIITDTSGGGWAGILTLHTPTWWVAMEPVPASLSTTSRGPSSCTTMTQPHQVATTSRFPSQWGHECGHALGRHNSTSSLPTCSMQCPNSMDAWWVPQDIQSQDELISNIGNKHQSCQWALPQSQLY